MSLYIAEISLGRQFSIFFKYHFIQTNIIFFSSMMISRWNYSWCIPYLFRYYWVYGNGVQFQQTQKHITYIVWSLVRELLFFLFSVLPFFELCREVKLVNWDQIRLQLPKTYEIYSSILSPIFYLWIKAIIIYHRLLIFHWQTTIFSISSQYMLISSSLSLPSVLL